MKTIALQVAKTTPGQLAFHACRIRPANRFDRCREFHGPAATITRGPNGTTFLLAILEAHHPLHVPFPSPPLSIERTTTNTVVVWWALSEVKWQLQSATNLSVSANWTDIPPPYTTKAPNCHFTEPLRAGTKFYRLRN